MQVKDYTKIIESTAVYPNSVGYFGPAYCMLGLMGELEEFHEALLLNNSHSAEKELGDICWYLTAFSLETQIDVEEVLYVSNDLIVTDDTPTTLVAKLFTYVGKVAEKIKKVYRDDLLLNKESQTMIERDLNTVIDVCIKAYNKQFESVASTNLNKVLQLNYNKLTARRATNTLHGSGNDREYAVNTQR